ncbi:hypothetical protein KEM48_014575 [Puccinia striiformis f. sp. tritici PST-130]|nr:hypothetical protein KEM48_014575 [Puccinia striiformis f. sp. tritici PST-130]
MPKIRKKTSKRSTTRMKEKIKHKVKEAHKKAKKNSKKDVTWKSRVKKDIGIPALFPFKDQVLAEQQQAKLQHAEERQALRQSGSTSAAATHAKSLQKVLALSDVLIEVLDARDPLGTRSLQLERDAVQQGKKVLLVLNKVDLVPKQNGSQATGREGSSTANGCSIQPLMQLLKNYARRTTVVDPSRPSSTVSGVKSLASITVGIIGFPNPSLWSRSNPGFTKEVQEIVLEKGLKVLDCPGVVLSIDTTNDETAAAHVLRNAVKVEQILDPIAPSRTSEEGGIPDLQGCAKAILQDWNTGRIPYYTVPPPLPKGEEKSKASTNTTDLALFANADREVLGQAEPQDNVIRPAVRMTCSEAGNGIPKSTQKEPSGPEIISLAPKKKSKQVNFTTTETTAATSSSSTSKKTSQLERMGITAPIGENKLIAKQARKERKKLAKSKGSNPIDQDEVTMEDAEQSNQLMSLCSKIKLIASPISFMVPKLLPSHFDPLLLYHLTTRMS